MNSYGCCCFSVELQSLISLITRLTKTLNDNAPAEALRGIGKQRETISLLKQQLDAYDWPSLDHIIFQGLTLSDVTVRLGRWSNEQARLLTIIQQVRVRLGGAVNKMPDLQNDLRELALNIAPVMQRAIATIVQLSNN